MEILAWFIGIVLVLALMAYFGFITYFSDGKIIIWYFLNRKNLKYKVVRKYIKGNQTIMFIGTVHWGHIKGKFYELRELRNIYSKVNPEVVMVESRPEQIAKGNVADGPIEMLYTYLHAKNDGYTVAGIDYHTLHDKSNSTTVSRDNKMLDNIEREMANHQLGLVFEGASHILTQKKEMKRRGYKEVKLSKKETKDLFKGDLYSNEFPKGSVDYLKYKIEVINNSEGKGSTEEERLKYKRGFTRELNAYIDFISGVDIFTEEYKKNRS